MTFHCFYSILFHCIPCFIHCTTHDPCDHPHFSFPPIFPAHSHLTCPSPYRYISHHALYFTTTDEDLDWVETSANHWQVTSVPIPRLVQFPDSEAWSLNSSYIAIRYPSYALGPLYIALVQSGGTLPPDNALFTTLCNHSTTTSPGRQHLTTSQHISHALIHYCCVNNHWTDIAQKS